MSPERVVAVVVRGRVQGVGFRAWTAERARRLGLRGWVRNRRDGSVEATFAGPAGAVETMLDACRQGPPSAGVESVSAGPTETDDLPAGFEQRPTA